MLYLSRTYICNYCPSEINKEEDGIVVFGSICCMGERGLKAKVGDVPTDQNVSQLGKLTTAICKKCFKKKFAFILENM